MKKWSRKVGNSKTKNEREGQEIVRLLNERAQVSVEIGKVKGKAECKCMTLPGSKVHDTCRSLIPDPYRQKALTTTFREIISASRDLQRPDDHRLFGTGSDIFPIWRAYAFRRVQAGFFPQTGISRVFEWGREGSIDWGVVPVENSLGRIREH